MKARMPSVEEQIVGIITGVWPPDAHDFSDFPATRFSVTREDLTAYFEGNPEAAEAYVKRHIETRPPNAIHDIVAIWEDGGVYRVAWLDHGNPIDIRSFSNVNHAVADHICQKIGIPI